MTPLTDNIRQRREASGLTRDQLAQQAGISVSALAKIESGREPTVPTLRAIARALGTTPDDLFRTTGQAA